MTRLPLPGDVWGTGHLLARVLSLHDGPPPGFLAWPEPKDPTVRWVLARLYVDGLAVALEALPLPRFVMRYGLEGDQAGPVN